MSAGATPDPFLSEPPAPIATLYARPRRTSMNQAKKPVNVAYLEQQTEAVRKSLSDSNQSALFEAAIKTGYLTALANDEEDEGEREALVEAIEILSSSLVLEWEVEPLLKKIAARIETERSAAR